MAELAFALAAETHPFFELLFLLAAPYLAQSFSYLQVSFRFAVLPPFAHPTKQLRCVEETITIVNQGRRCAVFEFKITGVTSFVSSLLIPDAGHRSDAAHHTAADEPYNIDVMRPLV